MGKSKVGCTVQIGGFDWIVLDYKVDKYLLTTVDIVAMKPFDEYREFSNYIHATIRDWLNVEFAENIPRELYSSIHSTVYNYYPQFKLHNAEYPCTDMIRLMFKYEYMKYQDLLPKCNYDWWLIDTPDAYSEYGYAVIDDYPTIIKNNEVDKLGVRPVMQVSEDVIADIECENRYAWVIILVGTATLLTLFWIGRLK